MVYLVCVLQGRFSGIVTKILLRSFPDSTLYPTKDILAEVILITFDVDRDNDARTIFINQWENTNCDLKKLVMKNVCDCRGTIVSEIKT